MNITHKVIFLLLTSVIFVGAASGDREVCERGQDEKSVSACSRLMSSGQLDLVDQAILHALRGTAYRQKGEFDPAIADFTRVIELTQKYASGKIIASAHVVRAGAYSLKGDLEKSLADYRAALALDPSNDQAANGIERIEAARAEAEQSRKNAEATTLPSAALSTGVSLTEDRERILKAKDSFKECDTCPEMVVVPAGSLLMGAPIGELSRMENEGPLHKVTFAKPFAVGRFSVTLDEYDRCAADGACEGYKPSDRGWGRGRRPAINVSWHDARAYIEWLSKKTSRKYRFLSEAEREYVTRAGTLTPFWVGQTISSKQANFDNTTSYAGGPRGEYPRKTLPVDSFAPNPWGLYQVHGNVWEWVEDCASNNYQSTPTDGSAWTDSDCSHRAVRGGSWYCSAGQLRSAHRSFVPVDRRDTDVGFRVARTLSSK
ncbi:MULTISPECIES: SUMF1/EgtB/PvdO family nonheme iron enzyme [unclassified Bradyrhizobium]|uniref:SUMF1/EgtB/PvdO family nonheme iron enzyme n=1 Tax=unclassified Bradyrhizobium TaxID=2631580 RepID=UPI0029166F80|nr:MULTISPECIES: SUMF1/EgtB/PvdO family nonheme iron enzyme [unclassified Bradyrhizobium]